MNGYFSTCLIAFADDFDIVFWLTLFIFLNKYLTLPLHLCNQQCGKGVDAGYPYTVQAAGHLIGVLVKLTPGMEHRHYYLQGRFVFFLIDSCRNASPIILYRNRIVFMDNHIDTITIASYCLVNRVVHHLINQVMQTFGTGITDIHGRPFTNSLQTLKYLYVIC